ncbi:MAG TPA: methylenetetrahydrofolate reductase, partial [Roseiflexaceae bacterium]|nr:methylenetetrahydrofolate reductase [Roseiflexaceae bacterium]
MEQAAQPETEGIAIAADLTRELLSIDGVRGVHIMSVGWTKAIPHVIERAGLLPRPPLPRAEGRE